MTGAGLVTLLLLRGPSQPVAELFQYHRRGGADIFNTSANYISFQILYTTDIYICIGYLTVRRLVPRPHSPWPRLHWDQGSGRQLKLSQL